MQKSKLVKELDMSHKTGKFIITVELNMTYISFKVLRYISNFLLSLGKLPRELNHFGWLHWKAKVFLYWLTKTKCESLMATKIRD